MKRKNIYPIIFLTCLTFVIIYFITPSSNIFGSNTDWLSQHVNLADYIRNTMLENKTIFPDFAFNIGAGQNIYNISYYGLLRVDILISCLLPSVEMKDIIITYMIFNLVLSVDLTYLWLKRKQFNTWLCIIGAITLLSSSVLFQSHRQIMFVDYMPMLIIALIAVDLYIEKKKMIMLVISILGIITSSYFFSISSLLVIFSYYCFEMYRLEIKLTFKEILHFLKPLLIAIMICGVLLIPTAYVLLENHQSGNTKINLLTLFIPRFNFESLLYDYYGCGLGYLTWVCLIVGLKIKKIKRLNIWLLLILFIPIFSFILNGFLYPRPKILIPFIPLLIYITIYVLNCLKYDDIKLNIKIILLLALPVLSFYQQPLAILDMILCGIGILLYLKNIKSALLLLIIMPIAISFVNNQEENYVLSDKYQQVSKIKDIKLGNDSRSDIFKEPLNTVNQVKNDVFRTSIYSSISNTRYNQFYYDIINNPISIRNRVACLSNSNIFFQGMMGVKTIYSENIVPIGYQEIEKNVYQNKDVLPLIYASNDLFSYKEFEKLSFPQTLDTLYNNVIVETDQINYQSKVTETKLKVSVKSKSDYLGIIKLSNGYRINTKKKAKLELDINQDLFNKIMIIEFDLKKVKLIKNTDTSITINGVRNRLSSLNAAYPNKNTHFTYILSQNEAIDKLEIEFSKGRYDLSDIRVYTIDYDIIKERNQEVDTFKGIYNQNGILADGEIDVKEDGYLVTSFAYQNGYKILVDNKEVNSECVNKTFLGAKISKGKHQVKITFKPPMKDIGFIVSVLGILLLAFQGRCKKGEKRIERTD
ncbi:YfhO family protein [Thomasclavelia cocleata]|uniref:YfhO family protein n=5 Tax=Thomasclavelia cocleata TaxID=69824 RepID=UPI00242E7198|nr:YfhO family protein [Thomasclavelia cocleata]